MSYHLRVFKGDLLNCGNSLLSVSVGPLRGMFVVGFFFLFLEINCCVCGIQWTNHFECPALLLLLLALSKLSPTHSAVVYLALGWRLVLPALLSWFNYFSSCWTMLFCVVQVTLPTEGVLNLKALVWFDCCNNCMFKLHAIPGIWEV